MNNKNFRSIFFASIFGVMCGVDDVLANNNQFIINGNQVNQDLLTIYQNNISIAVAEMKKRDICEVYNFIMNNQEMIHEDFFGTFIDYVDMYEIVERMNSAQIVDVLSIQNGDFATYWGGVLYSK